MGTGLLIAAVVLWAIAMALILHIAYQDDEPPGGPFSF